MIKKTGNKKRKDILYKYLKFFNQIKYRPDTRKIEIAVGIICDFENKIKPKGKNPIKL